LLLIFFHLRTLPSNLDLVRLDPFRSPAIPRLNVQFPSLFFLFSLVPFVPVSRLYLGLVPLCGTSSYSFCFSTASIPPSGMLPLVSPHTVPSSLPCGFWLDLFCIYNAWFCAPVCFSLRPVPSYILFPFHFGFFLLWTSREDKTLRCLAPSPPILPPTSLRRSSPPAQRSPFSLFPSRLKCAAWLVLPCRLPLAPLPKHPPKEILYLNAPSCFWAWSVSRLHFSQPSPRPTSLDRPSTPSPLFPPASPWLHLPCVSRGFTLLVYRQLISSCCRVSPVRVDGLSSPDSPLMFLSLFFACIPLPFSSFPCGCRLISVRALYCMTASSPHEHLSMVSVSTPYAS